MRKQIPDAELAVLKVLWEGEARTVREIAEALYQGAAPSEQATVQKLLERLESRQCVSRRRVGRANEWVPNVERADLVRDRLRDAADKLFDGSLAPVLTELVNASRLDPDELRELRKLIDDADESSPQEEA